MVGLNRGSEQNEIGSADQRINSEESIQEVPIIRGKGPSQIVAADYIPGGRTFPSNHRGTGL